MNNEGSGSLPSDSRRVTVARVLDVLAPAGLLIGVGVGVGYWIADRGVPWLPTVLEGLVVLGAVCVLTLLVAIRLRRDHVSVTPQGLRLRKRVAAIFVVLLVAALVWLGQHLAEQPSPLTLMPPNDLGEAFELDAQRFREHAAGLAAAVDRLEEVEFLRAETPDVLGPEEEALLLGSFMVVVDFTTAIDATRQFYEDWYRFDPSRNQRPWLLRAFLLEMACDAALLQEAGRLARLIEAHPHARKYLDVPHESVGMASGSWSTWSETFAGADQQARVLAEAQYLRWIDDVMKWRGDAWAEGLGWLWSDVEDRAEELATLGLLDHAALLVAGDGAALRTQLKRRWLPAQTEIAHWFGDTKLRRIGWYLITREQQEEMDRHLEPGDLIITRKNWFMSNVGLPGWWPHGILYIGAPDKLLAWADDAEVTALVSELAGEPTTWEDYMEARFASDWARFMRGAAPDDPHRLIEAYSPGVVLNPLSASSGDSLAVLRPRLSKRAKAHAIIEAFTHLGKPYDFDFDFATDHALVCTEVLWRAYRPAEGKDGLDLPITDVAGRRTLPAIEIVRMYVETRDDPDRQLDFVYFLDAQEELQRSIVSTVDVFVTTPERGKWGAL